MLEPCNMNDDKKLGNSYNSRETVYFPQKQLINITKFQSTKNYNSVSFFMNSIVTKRLSYTINYSLFLSTLLIVN